MERMESIRVVRICDCPHRNPCRKDQIANQVEKGTSETYEENEVAIENSSLTGLSSERNKALAGMQENIELNKYCEITGIFNMKLHQQIGTSYRSRSEFFCCTFTYEKYFSEFSDIKY
jgi:hypothetical protein